MIVAALKSVCCVLARKGFHYTELLKAAWVTVELVLWSVKLCLQTRKIFLLWPNCSSLCVGCACCVSSENDISLVSGSYIVLQIWNSDNKNVFLYVILVKCVYAICIWNLNSIFTWSFLHGASKASSISSRFFQSALAEGRVAFVLVGFSFFNHTGVLCWFFRRFLNTLFFLFVLPICKNLHVWRRTCSFPSLRRFVYSLRNERPFF